MASKEIKICGKTYPTDGNGWIVVDGMSYMIESAPIEGGKFKGEYKRCDICNGFKINKHKNYKICYNCNMKRAVCANKRCTRKLYYDNKYTARGYCTKNCYEDAEMNNEFSAKQELNSFIEKIIKN